MAGRPGGTNREVTGKAKDIAKHGSGLGTGPVGSTGGMSGHNVSHGSSGGSGGGKRSGGGMNPLVLIVVIVIALMGGGGGLSGLLGGGSSDDYPQVSSSGTGYSQSSGSSSSVFDNGNTGSTAGTNAGTGSSVSSTPRTFRVTAPWPLCLAAPIPRLTVPRPPVLRISILPSQAMHVRREPKSSAATGIWSRSWSTCAERIWSPEAEWRPRTFRK